MISHAYINGGDLKELGKVWFYFINFVLKPSMHISTVRQDRAILLYELVKGYEVDLGRIIKDLILEYVKGNFVGNIPHPSLITLLCIKGVVKYNDEEEERCPKTSPLTLTRVLKAPIESEERERIKEPTRKRKRIETQAKRTRETEELRGVSPVRDQTSTTISDEGESSEKWEDLKQT